LIPELAALADQNEEFVQPISNGARGAYCNDEEAFAGTQAANTTNRVKEKK
jgi:hypothetical protein